MSNLFKRMYDKRIQQLKASRGIEIDRIRHLETIDASPEQSHESPCNTVEYGGADQVAVTVEKEEQFEDKVEDELDNNTE